jgi:hypothetical protein
MLPHLNPPRPKYTHKYLAHLYFSKHCFREKNAPECVWVRLFAGIPKVQYEPPAICRALHLGKEIKMCCCAWKEMHARARHKFQRLIGIARDCRAHRKMLPHHLFIHSRTFTSIINGVLRVKYQWIIRIPARLTLPVLESCYAAPAHQLSAWNIPINLKTEKCGVCFSISVLTLKGIKIKL